MRLFVELWSFSTSHLLNSGTKDIQWMSCTSDGCLLSQAGLPGSLRYAYLLQVKLEASAPVTALRHVDAGIARLRVHEVLSRFVAAISGEREGDAAVDAHGGALDAACSFNIPYSLV